MGCRGNGYVRRRLLDVSRELASYTLHTAILLYPYRGTNQGVLETVRKYCDVYTGS